MILKLLGTLIKPSDQYSTKSHRRFAIVLSELIKIVVSSVVVASFVTFCYLSYNYQNFQILNSSIWTLQQWSLVIVSIWTVLEIAFYLYCLNVKRNFSNTSSILQLTLSEKLFHLQRILDHNPNVFKSLEKWFHKRDALNADDEIKLEHIEEWLSWAFFNKLARKMTQDELFELNLIVEKCLERDPSLGRLRNARSTATGDYKRLEFMMLSLDPIQFQHKPLFAYLVSC